MYQKTAIHRVNAYSTKLNGGKPCAVFMLEQPLSTSQMQALQRESGTDEAVFVIRSPGSQFHVHVVSAQKVTVSDKSPNTSLMAAAHSIWEQRLVPFLEKIHLQCDEQIYTFEKRQDHIVIHLPIVASQKDQNLFPYSPVSSASRGRLALIELATEEALAGCELHPFLELQAFDTVGVYARSKLADRDFACRFFSRLHQEELGCELPLIHSLACHLAEQSMISHFSMEIMASRKSLVHVQRTSDEGLDIIGKALTSLKGLVVAKV